MDLEDARRRYHYSFTAEDHQRLPFYSALMTELENDLVAQVLLAGIRVEQRNPMLVLASLHLAALRGHPVLAPIYLAAREGSLSDPEVAARRVLEVVNAQPDLVRSQLHRSTQTNEPGRSAVFQTVIALIARDGHPSINLIDVGTAGGLNLYFDQYPVRDTDDDNPLTLVCRDETPVDRLLALPSVVSRVGIDPSPLDLANDDDRLWLEACLWPEEPRRMTRLEAIIAQRTSWPEVTVLRGTVAERLDDALALGDPSMLTVVLNSYVVAYFSGDEQTAFFNDMVERCAKGNVAWISLESPFMVNFPTTSTESESARKGATEVLVTLPGSAPRHWGWCHHHGLWTELDVPV
ncbi:MAG TPA: DUF2332 domain-containing protein [Acidimicrobiales bacterium]|nr:DUF2332 domain-containing protein [Acidimicrobiales bacterium]